MKIVAADLIRSIKVDLHKEECFVYYLTQYLEQSVPKKSMLL